MQSSKQMRWCLLLSLVIAGSTLVANSSKAGATEPRWDSAEAVVNSLYDLVTFEPGISPDWGAVRSLFLEEATIVLRTSRESTTVFSLDGFVDDFARFIIDDELEERGFQENIVRMKTLVFGDLAHTSLSSTKPGSRIPTAIRNRVSTAFSL